MSCALRDKAHNKVIDRIITFFILFRGCKIRIIFDINYIQQEKKNDLYLFHIIQPIARGQKKREEDCKSRYNQSWPKLVILPSSHILSWPRLVMRMEKNDQSWPGLGMRRWENDHFWPRKGMPRSDGAL